ncbi:hypothetical protein EYF80_017291 [Liparis tanakae]|uniref:Uncharacterized protein n=1 Tax=Liparis tanakae TaxID=230148 RepID=A0A4Z2I4Z2_9TELE|nr:hypothetical protein EYF80_017291 [Liparis tanakae]
MQLSGTRRLRSQRSRAWGRKQAGVYLAWQSRTYSKGEAVESSRRGRVRLRGSVSIHPIDVREPEVLLQRQSEHGDKKGAGGKSRRLPNRIKFGGGHVRGGGGGGEGGRGGAEAMRRSVRINKLVVRSLLTSFVLLLAFGKLLPPAALLLQLAELQLLKLLGPRLQSFSSLSTGRRTCRLFTLAELELQLSDDFIFRLRLLLLCPPLGLQQGLLHLHLRDIHGVRICKPPVKLTKWWNSFHLKDLLQLQFTDSVLQVIDPGQNPAPLLLQLSEAGWEGVEEWWGGGAVGCGQRMDNKYAIYDLVWVRIGKSLQSSTTALKVRAALPFGKFSVEPYAASPAALDRKTGGGMFTPFYSGHMGSVMLWGDELVDGCQGI